MALLLILYAKGTEIFVKTGAALTMALLRLAASLRHCWSKALVSPCSGTPHFFVLTNTFPEQRNFFFFCLRRNSCVFKPQVILLNLTDAREGKKINQDPIDSNGRKINLFLLKIYQVKLNNKII